MITNEENPKIFESIKYYLKDKSDIILDSQQKEESIFKQASYGKIPELGNHNPSE